ncbi:hypothetical protein K9L97_02280 [Candidatus Woesearchaeota archaeon]|nr:hypothetical protein [Candidatus Woesearchaeota archaeon]
MFESTKYFKDENLNKDHISNLKKIIDENYDKLLNFISPTDLNKPFNKINHWSLTDPIKRIDNIMDDLASESIYYISKNKNSFDLSDNVKIISLISNLADELKPYLKKLDTPKELSPRIIFTEKLCGVYEQKIINMLDSYK